MAPPHAHKTSSMGKRNSTSTASILVTDTDLPTPLVDPTANYLALHFQDPPGTQSKKLAVALGVGISSFVLLTTLIYLLIRRRRQLLKRKNSKPTTKSVGSSSSNDKPKPSKPSKTPKTSTTIFSSKAHWKSKRTSAPPTRPSNPTPTQQPPTSESSRGSTFPIISIPSRAKTRTPIAELSTTRSISELESISTSGNPQFSTAFTSRRQSLPPLPKLNIQNSHSRNLSTPFNRLYTSPEQEISALTPNAAANLVARHGGGGSGSGSEGNSNGSGSISTFGKSPQLAFSPVSPLESQSATTTTSSIAAGAGMGQQGSNLTITTRSVTSSNYGSMRRNNTVVESGMASCFPYGYQSEYPEVIERMAEETQSPCSPLERQRAMLVLEEEERIVKQKMNAVRELVRLKNEEARILEAKRQLGIAVR